MDRRAARVRLFFLSFQLVGTMSWNRVCEKIRSHHECEGGIEKSEPRITDWHHKPCRVMSKGDHKGRIFLSHPHTNCFLSHPHKMHFMNIQRNPLNKSNPFFQTNLVSFLSDIGKHWRPRSYVWSWSPMLAHRILF